MPAHANSVISLGVVAQHPDLASRGTQNTYFIRGQILRGGKQVTDVKEKTGKIF
jgi:hypothetical protein